MPREVSMLFEELLHLSTVSESTRNAFFISMRKYLEHGRHEGHVEGRSHDYLKEHLTELMLFMDAVELTNEEIVQILTNMPSLLNTSKDIITKYLLLFKNLFFFLIFIIGMFRK